MKKRREGKAKRSGKRETEQRRRSVSGERKGKKCKRREKRKAIGRRKESDGRRKESEGEKLYLARLTAAAGLIPAEARWLSSCVTDLAFAPFPSGAAVPTKKKKTMNQ